MKPELIESSEQMDDLLARLSGHRLIAVDTEFFRETSYFPKLALVQIATDDIVACIDPLAFDARTGLKKILLDTDVTKIFHSCSQDMEVLFYYLGETPAPVYDTQIANALLSEQHQVGYATLVENELGVSLDKSQTRTNWLQRPLSSKQIQYAGDDVLYLYQLHEVLEDRLQAAGRKTWFEEDNHNYSCNDTGYLPATDQLWKRVKGTNRLSRRQLAVVQAVAEWREQLAQEKNITRRKVLVDDIIVKVALEIPDDSDTLRNAIEHSIGQRYSFSNGELDGLRNAIEATINASPDCWPDNRFNTMDSQQKTLLKRLQQQTNEKAQELGISATVLCARKELEKLILLIPDNLVPDNSGLLASPQQLDSNVMRGWRYQCIGKQLSETLLTAAEHSG
jgi:ribonuclease D